MARAIHIASRMVSAIKGIERACWIGLLVGFLTAAISAVLIYFIPDRYEARTRVFIDTQAVVQTLMPGLSVQPDIEQQIQIVSAALINRSDMEKLIRVADLDLTVNSLIERDQLVDALVRDVHIRRDNAVHIYMISYRHSERETAHRVVLAMNSMLSERFMGQRMAADSVHQEGKSEATQITDFRVIDQPQVSPEPVEPHRVSLSALALVAALLAGALSRTAAKFYSSPTVTHFEGS